MFGCRCVEFDKRTGELLGSCCVEFDEGDFRRRSFRTLDGKHSLADKEKIMYPLKNNNFKKKKAVLAPSLISTEKEKEKDKVEVAAKIDADDSAMETPVVFVLKPVEIKVPELSKRQELEDGSLVDLMEADTENKSDHDEKGLINGDKLVEGGMNNEYDMKLDLDLNEFVSDNHGSHKTTSGAVVTDVGVTESGTKEFDNSVMAVDARKKVLPFDLNLPATEEDDQEFN